MKKLKQHKAFTKLSNPYVLNTLMVLGVLLILFLVIGLVPFGDRTIASIDLGSQYIDMYNYFVNVLTGQDGFHYSFYKGSGGGMFALWMYYLMSPFNLIYLLFNQQNIIYGVHLVYVMKILALTLTTTHYLVKKQVTTKINLTLTLGFVFSNYLVMYGFHLMWWDAFILLPLLTLALERGLTTGKWGRYTLLLTLAIITNFYVGYMVGLFTLTYVLYKYLTKDKETKYNFWGYVRNCIYSGIMSLWVLIPTANTIIGSVNGLARTSKELFTQFDVSKVIVNVRTVMTTIENYSHTTPLLMMGTLVLMLTILVLIYTTKKYQRAFYIILSIYLLSFLIKPVGYIWTIGQEETWFLYRNAIYLLWTGVIFIVDNKDILDTQLNKKVKALLIAVLVIPNIIIFINSEEDIMAAGLVMLIFTVVYGLFILVSKRLIVNINISIHILEIIVITLWGGKLIYVNNSNSEYIESHNYETEQVQTNIELEQGERIFYNRTLKETNKGLTHRQSKTSHTSSTVSKYEREFTRLTGMIDTYSSVGVEGDTPFSLALNNIKYINVNLDGEGDLPNYYVKDDTHYRPILEGLYENKTLLGFGYTITPQELNEEDFDIVLDGTTLGILGKDYSQPYTAEIKDTQNITLLEDGGRYKVDDVSKDATITYQLEGGDLYTHYYFKPTKVVYNEQTDEREYQLPYIGSEFLNYLPKDVKEVTYTLYSIESNVKDEFKENKLPQFYKIDTQDFNRDIQEFYNHHSKITELQIGNQSITGKVDNQYGDSHLQLNLPYDEGWIAVINTEEVEPINYVGRLTIPLTHDGQSDIQLTYRTPYLTESVLLSLLGLLLFIGECVYFKKMEDKQA